MSIDGNKHKFKNEIKELIDQVTGRKVLFVATTYLEYLRIQQELSLIERHADETILIASNNKSYLIRLVYIYWKLLFLRSSRYDLVFVGFAPQLVIVSWWWKFRKKQTIIDFFISIYDTLVFDRKKFSKGSWVAKLLFKWDKFTLSKADLILADTQQHANYFTQTLNADAGKVLVFYLAADSSFYYPRKIPKAEAYQGKYVIFYFATALPLQGVDVVIDSIANIDSSMIYFIFVGPISHEKLEVLKKQSNLTYFPWLEQSKLADLIAQADLCIAGHFNDNIEKAKRTIPGKAYIFEAMQKPIVLGDNVANRERYPACYENVKFVKMGDSIALTNALMQFYEETNDG